MSRRITTGIILAVSMAAIVLLTPVLVFKCFVILVAGLALNEFFNLVFKNYTIYRYIGLFFGLVVACLISFNYSLNLIVFVFIFGLFIVAMVQMLHSSVLEGTTERIGLTLFGMLYLGATLPLLGWMRELDHGRTLLFIALAGAACSDTAAYVVGRGIGKRRLAGLVSPNKTVAGFVAGFFGSTIAVLFFRWISWPELNLVHVLILGIVIGFTAPLGDLIESMFKRDYHIKDSGNIIPGHGGILDRIDAQIFTGPAVYFYFKWFIS